MESVDGPTYIGARLQRGAEASAERHHSQRHSRPRRASPVALTKRAAQAILQRGEVGTTRAGNAQQTTSNTTTGGARCATQALCVLLWKCVRLKRIVADVDR